MAKEDSGVDGLNASDPVDSIRVSLRYDRVFRALNTSSGICTHLAFYHWLRSDINSFLPHQTLLAAWGDFVAGQISYDITSPIEGVNTRLINEVGGLDLLVKRLFTQVDQSGRGWLIFEDIHSISAECGINVNSRQYRKATSDVAAILAYVMHNEREGHDCLYIFALTDEAVDIDPVVLELLMPHIDSALRRIKCFPPSRYVEADQTSDYAASLSEREQEVLHWVSQGKSNEEIGTILSISHNTVKNHLKRIFKKMGVTARSQAVRAYMQDTARSR
jgi:transcriptional regulator EpsA